MAGGLNLYGFAAGDPVNFSDPFGLSADTLEIIGSKNFKATIQELRESDTHVDADFQKLEQSTDVYVIAENPEVTGGYTVGGKPLSKLERDPQAIVDQEAASLGITDRKVRGLSYVGHYGSVPPSWLAWHEAIHLGCIDTAGIKCGHSSSAFNYANWKFKAAGYPIPK